MTKIAQPHRIENAPEKDTLLASSRSTLPAPAFGQLALRFVQKQCGRCGVATKKREFCSACRRFFQIVNGPKSIFIAHYWPGTHP